MGNSFMGIVYGAVAILILVVLASALLLPEFGKSYGYCVAPVWKMDTDYSASNCSDGVTRGGNASAITAAGSYAANNGITYPCTTDCNPDSANFCVNCDTRGGYRTSNQGLLLLVLVMALIGIGLTYIKI